MQGLYPNPTLLTCENLAAAYFTNPIIVCHIMKNLLFLFALIVLLASCKDENIPDVSDIKVELQVERFEQDFFALDTNNLAPSMEELAKKYPTFLPSFMVNVLGIPPAMLADTAATQSVKRFLADYRPIKDTADKAFSDIDNIVADVRKGLQFTRYYFPAYKVPKKLTTFIGPLDAYYEASLGGYGDVIMQEHLGVGLQLHLGRNYTVYNSPLGQQLYPSYVSRRFEAANIPVNCMKNIVDDIFPDKTAGRPLIEQIIDKGKRMYILDRLLPYTEDSLKIGYTKKQLEGCYENEALIWNFFLTNSLLFNIDPAVTKNYVQDGPKTEELGEGSPGYIGLFTGWQIVNKYMDTHPDQTLQQLIEMDARKLFEESKYKPK
jgi:hypothetical protein